MIQTGGIPFANQRGRPPAFGLGASLSRQSTGAGKGGGFEEEDRSRDWFCGKCRERNFLKRNECYKCGSVKPADGGKQFAPPKLEAGATVNGMVKSYNRKGFGFLMILGGEYFQDIYYTRENLSPNLETRDIPGQHVTFEVHRLPDGRLTAVSIRPLGEDKPERPSVFAVRPPVPTVSVAVGGKGSSVSPSAFVAGFTGGGFSSNPKTFKDGVEDRSQDWKCGACGERNFVKRTECFKCKADKSQVGPLTGDSISAAQDRRWAAADAARAGRALSPHAGSRAYAMSAMAGGRGRSPSRKKKRKGKKKKRRSSSSSSSGSSRKSRSSSSSSRSRKKKKKRRKGSNSSSRSKSSRSEDRAAGAAAASNLQSEPAAPANPGVEKAKAEALEEMLKLRDVQPKEARMSEWRALLRKWHPDKNPDRVEVATTVFQFLQRGKPMLEGS